MQTELIKPSFNWSYWGSICNWLKHGVLKAWSKKCDHLNWLLFILIFLVKSYLIVFASFTDQENSQYDIGNGASEIDTIYAENDVIFRQSFVFDKVFSNPSSFESVRWKK